MCGLSAIRRIMKLKHVCENGVGQQVRDVRDDLDRVIGRQPGNHARRGLAQDRLRPAGHGGADEANRST